MQDCTTRALSSIISFNVLAFPEMPVHIKIPDLLTSDVDQWIGVCAGALHHGKWAPAEQFIEILNAVQHKSNVSLGLIFLGDQKDNPHSLEIIKGLQDFGKIINHCGKSSLSESAALLSKCATVLSNDSALGHLAESVHVDVAMLFGPTVEAFGFVHQKWIYELPLRRQTLFHCNRQFAGC
jgi:ADP-heptose:LPS heptosyltransferase